MVPVLLANLIFAGIGIGIVASVAIQVVRFVNFVVGHIVNWAKNKIKSKSDKVLVADTKDILKEKMKTADRKSLSDLERMAEENPIMMAHYNEDTDEIDTIDCVQAEKIDSQVWQTLEDSNGMLVIES
jgi:SpoVK/Ycf46/Vps4 family AAA+-type ATPase